MLTSRAVAASTTLIDVAPPFDWGIEGAGPLLIAGPCSAESAEQVEQVARAIAESAPDVSILRAGIWKPRTRPGSFMGVGERGISWLIRAREITGLKVAMEVATPAHVAAALDAGVDVLWIGARTTSSPFALQELADALEGHEDLPVMVKNPISPDVELWLGALERLSRAGIRKLAAVLRGVTPHAHIEYRNDPGWRLAVDLRRRVPNLPILCDPSHIAGQRKWVAEVSQHALDLGLDGLMVEVHPDPENALSDAGQQLTPTSLVELLGGLVHKRPTPESAPDYERRLAALRKRIDGLDSALLSVLASRQEVSAAIGQMKRELAVTVLQPGRWDELLHDRIGQAEHLGLPADLVEDIFAAVHEASIRHQRKTST